MRSYRMPTSCRPYQPDHMMLLPAAPQDRRPPGHLADVIHETIATPDLGAVCARNVGCGALNQPFHLAMLVKVLVYSCTTGVFSSRKTERHLHEDLALRMRTAGNYLKLNTIQALHPRHQQPATASRTSAARAPGCGGASSTSPARIAKSIASPRLLTAPSTYFQCGLVLLLSEKNGPNHRPPRTALRSSHHAHSAERPLAGC